MAPALPPATLDVWFRNQQLQRNTTARAASCLFAYLSTNGSVKLVYCEYGSLIFLSVKWAPAAIVQPKARWWIDSAAAAAACSLSSHTVPSCGCHASVTFPWCEKQSRIFFYCSWKKYATAHSRHFSFFFSPSRLADRCCYFQNVTENMLWIINNKRKL